MIWAALSSESLRVILLMAAVLIIGAVVIPRLGGWIFSPHDQSFIYVLLVVLLALGFWLRDTIMEFKEKHGGLFFLLVFLFIFFLAMTFIAKDRTKKKE